MSERYLRLFALTPNLYQEGSPVMTAAGALLKDNASGNLLAQLKLRSLSDKLIKAVTVSVQPLDAAAAGLGDPVDFRYRGLSAARDAEFGQKQPILLPDRRCVQFSVLIRSVVFEDETVWEASAIPPVPLEDPVPLPEYFGGDTELVKQYTIDYGQDSRVFPKESAGLWICSCGSYNHAEEALCHSCGNEKSSLFSFSLSSLTRRKDERLKDEAYELALIHKNKDTLESLKTAAAEFEKLGDFWDSEDQLVICRERIDQLTEAAAAKARKIRRTVRIAAAVAALAAVIVLAGYLAAVNIILPDRRYKAAVSLMENGDYAKAIAAFEEMDGYKDSEEQIKECWYRTGLSLMEQAEEEEVSYLAQAKYEKAIEAFEYAGSHTNAAAQIEACHYRILKVGLRGARTGKEITFGTYEQDGRTGNGAEPLKWLVLDVSEDGSRILLLCSSAIDCRQFHSEDREITWDRCSLRSWLNTSFPAESFTEQELSLIAETEIPAEKRPDSAAPAGAAVKDKLFLLSTQEATNYFSFPYKRQCKPSRYARDLGVTTDTSGNCRWWLRSPGKVSDISACVYGDGSIHENGNRVDREYVGVRPAMWLDLGN